MEKFVSIEIDREPNGNKRVKNYFLNNDKTNWLIKAQSYFTKVDKKVARLNHKNTK